ncbi:MAG TPA: FAD:protein FMN transferase [Nitrospiria bacterium]|nr:FAD:protein FMN transferase [Nitrospiria bacterium]
MGSILEITLPGIGPERGDELFQAGFAEARRIERLLNAFDPASELSRLNREACLGPVAVADELVRLIEQARHLSTVSGGAVDATVLPLTRLWRLRDDRHGGTGRPPSSTEISRARASVGFQRVLVDPRRGTVSYNSPNVQLEFGAMGKGYAVDQVVRALVASGVSSALVDFGSTIYALGRPPGDDAWRVGVRHPRDPHRVLDVVRLVDRALSTSGDDQQAIVINGVRYGHIIDPRTGQPATGAVAASVIAPTALEADALSTAGFVLGPRDGASLLRRTGRDGIITTETRGRLLNRTDTPGWNAFLARPRQIEGPTRRRILVGMAAAVAAIVLRPALGHAVVFMSREEALRGLMPEAEGFREEMVSLSDAQRERLASLINGRVSEAEVTFFVGEQSGRVAGYATVLNVIGKEQPITFMVAVSPDGAVRGVQVLTYLESQGSEIRSKRFLEQFAGKTLAAPLKLGRDVHGISGASLSSRSTAYAVKKALALAAVVYGTPGGAW